MGTLNKPIEEIRNYISTILKQGDNRYNNFEGETLLANLVLKEIISFKENEIPYINKRDLEPREICKMGYVQIEEKYIAKILLQEKGFSEKEIFFEKEFLGSKPDVFGKSEDKFILVECCACRIDKIFNYIQDSNEVWIITRNFSDQEMKWFIFKKGLNWEEFYKIKEMEEEKLKQIKSPIDGILK